MCITLTIGPDAATREENIVLRGIVQTQAETIRALLARERGECGDEQRATRAEGER